VEYQSSGADDHSVPLATAGRLERCGDLGAAQLRSQDRRKQDVTRWTRIQKLNGTVRLLAIRPGPYPRNHKTLEGRDKARPADCTAVLPRTSERCARPLTDDALGDSCIASRDTYNAPYAPITTRAWRSQHASPDTFTQKSGVPPTYPDLQNYETGI